MKDAILIELANRWDRDRLKNTTEDGSKEAEIPNAVAKGHREGLRECADALRSLVNLLGEQE
jgi:hypothetical protein